MYINIKFLGYAPEINAILYVNYSSIEKGKGTKETQVSHMGELLIYSENGESNKLS